MFLIIADHGEYDDYTTIPLLIVPDQQTAELVVDEMYNPKGEFRKLIDEKHGFPDGTSEGYFEGIGYSYRKVDYFEIRWSNTR